MLRRTASALGLACLLLLASLLVNGPARSQTAAPRYPVIDLGSFGGGYGTAHAVNDGGQVVGYSLSTDKEHHGFLWQHGTLQNLYEAAGMWTATAINQAGSVAGYDPYGQSAAIWDGHATRTLSFGPYWHEIAAVSDINDHGAICGEWGAHPFYRAVAGKPGEIRNLPSFADRERVYNATQALALNDRGLVVGWAENGKPDYYGSRFLHHACSWRNGIAQNLGTLGGPESKAFAVNNSGQIVGMAQVPWGRQNFHACLWQNGAVIDLIPRPNTTSQAVGINERGQVVGYGWTRQNGVQSTLFSFIWDEGRLQVLDPLLSPGWTGFTPASINNRGQIAGSAHNAAGETRPVLLGPASSTP